jgi:GT2 family glycosyltransferase
MIHVIIPCYLLPDRDNELLHFTKNCIDSLKKNTSQPYRVLIIDNASTVGAGYLQAIADSGYYIRNKENLGYAKAVNQGLQRSLSESPDWIVVANNDIEFLPGWFEAMSGAWGEKTGVVSSHLHVHDPEHKAGVEIAHVGLMFGALWLTKPGIVSHVGLLDESFEFGYYEDKDWWQRIAAAGYTMKKAGWCNHIGNATSGKMENMNQFFFENKAKYEAKWQINSGN